MDKTFSKIIVNGQSVSLSLGDMEQKILTLESKVQDLEAKLITKETMAAAFGQLVKVEEDQVVFDTTYFDEEDGPSGQPAA